MEPLPLTPSPVGSALPVVPPKLLFTHPAHWRELLLDGEARPCLREWMPSAGSGIQPRALGAWHSVPWPSRPSRPSRGWALGGPLLWLLPVASGYRASGEGRREESLALGLIKG